MAAEDCKHTRGGGGIARRCGDGKPHMPNEDAPCHSGMLQKSARRTHVPLATACKGGMQPPLGGGECHSCRLGGGGG